MLLLLFLLLVLLLLLLFFFFFLFFLLSLFLMLLLLRRCTPLVPRCRAPARTATRAVSVVRLASSASAPTVAVEEKQLPYRGVLVDLRAADAPSLSIQRNVCDAFDGFMRRLGQLAEKKVGKAVLAALKTDGFPAEFVDQINWCRKRTIIDADLAESLHRLRLWRNAATHHNNERWAREGPSSADEVSRLVAKIDTALAAL